MWHECHDVVLTNSMSFKGLSHYRGGCGCVGEPRVCFLSVNRRTFPDAAPSYLIGFLCIAFFFFQEIVHNTINMTFFFSCNVLKIILECTVMSIKLFSSFLLNSCTLIL